MRSVQVTCFSLMFDFVNQLAQLSELICGDRMRAVSTEILLVSYGIWFHVVLIN